MASVGLRLWKEGEGARPIWKYSWTTRGEPTMDGEVARGATTRAAACYTGTPVRPLGPFGLRV